jgi:hypothetical protein
MRHRRVPASCYTRAPTTAPSTPWWSTRRTGASSRGPPTAPSRCGAACTAPRLTPSSSCSAPVQPCAPPSSKRRVRGRRQRPRGRRDLALPPESHLTLPGNHLYDGDTEMGMARRGTQQHDGGAERHLVQRSPSASSSLVSIQFSVELLVMPRHPARVREQGEERGRGLQDLGRRFSQKDQGPSVHCPRWQLHVSCWRLYGYICTFRHQKV